LTLFDRALVKALPVVPRGIVRRLSSPYIAGPALEDAVQCVQRLNRAGKAATIDVLGEEIADLDEAHDIAREYHRVLARIESERLDAGVSVKLTGLGLQLDGDLCRTLLTQLVDDAAVRGNFVRIDMEDSSTTDATLALYRSLRDTGHTNVGVVLQAYLRRTFDDVPGLDDVRLCKGIYVEPASVAYQDPEEVRASFAAALAALLDRDAYVGIATHDEALIEEALRQIRDRGLAPDRYEFQMLLGVRTGRADELVRAGHRLRVYVPYGTQWYEYSLRRLQENPKLAGYVAADTLRRRRT
jgi:proline dehydrogenase